MNVQTRPISAALSHPSLPARSLPSERARLVGRVLSGLGVVFLTFDAAMKLLQAAPAVEGTLTLGFPAHLVLPIGLIQLACLALYLVPRTSLLGGLLWVGYLGGAVATHVRLENPLFSHVLFPLYIAALLWGGLWLRDARARALFAAPAKAA